MTGEEKAEKVRFIADTMLGRLARWLRLLGYDTLYLGDVEDHVLAKVATAQRRVLLTRDTELAERKGFDKVLICSGNLREQLIQVMEELSLKVEGSPFSRCLVCNQRLVPVDKQSVRGEVPAYVFATQEEFVRCLGCDKVYWPGTHLDRIREELGKLRLKKDEERL